MPAPPPRAAATFQGDDPKHVRSTSRSKRASHATCQERALTLPPSWPYTDMGNPVLPCTWQRDPLHLPLRPSLSHRHHCSQLGPCIPRKGLDDRTGPVLHTTHARIILYGHWRTVDLISIVFLCPIHLQIVALGASLSVIDSERSFCRSLSQKFVPVGHRLG